MCLDVTQRRLEFGFAQRAALGPHRLAPETEAAIDGADMGGQQQHAIGIAMHDALNRRVRGIADRIGQFFGRHQSFAWIRHELRRDRIDRAASVLDQAQHAGRDRDLKALDHRRQFGGALGRHHAGSDQVCKRAQGFGRSRHGYWFMVPKKSALFLEVLSLSSRNSMASTTPIGMRMRRSTHILLSVALSTSSSSLRVPDLVMSMAGKVRLSESLRSRMISELPVPLNSSKITSSMRLPVSIRAVAMMVSEPPSSMLRAAP